MTGFHVEGKAVEHAKLRNAREKAAPGSVYWMGGHSEHPGFDIALKKTRDEGGKKSDFLTLWTTRFDPSFKTIKVPRRMELSCLVSRHGEGEGQEAWLAGFHSDFAGGASEHLLPVALEIIKEVYGVPVAKVWPRTVELVVPLLKAGFSFHREDSFWRNEAYVEKLKRELEDLVKFETENVFSPEVLETFGSEQVKKKRFGKKARQVEKPLGLDSHLKLKQVLGSLGEGDVDTAVEHFNDYVSLVMKEASGVGNGEHRQAFYKAKLGFYKEMGDLLSAAGRVESGVSPFLHRRLD